MKGLGLMMSSMDLEKYIMTAQFSLMTDLITPTLIYSKTIGNITKECWLMIQNKEEVEYLLQMDKSLKVISTMIKSKVLGNF